VTARREQVREAEGPHEIPTAAPAAASALGDMRELASLVGNQAFATVAANPPTAGPAARLLRQPAATADPTTPTSVPPELDRE
jgi:hypothetical protein